MERSPSFLAASLADTAVADAAARWFLRSGIVEPDSGVARYHFAEERRNAPVSNEITGYAVSSMLDLFDITGDRNVLEQARRSGEYLLSQWNPALRNMPFEPLAGGRGFTYFFDCGIIARALLRLQRVTGDPRFYATALHIAESMASDFPAPAGYHPILTLPAKEPLDHEPKWSRSPGCYHLKAALAWREIEGFDDALAHQLDFSLATHRDFLATGNDDEVMNRLHAYCYFLEALLFFLDQEACREALIFGIHGVAERLRALRHSFERSDVCGQLLRARLHADQLGVLPLDIQAASEEASWAASYLRLDRERPMEQGFWFGKRSGEFTAFVNPVSTAFCAQALHLWTLHQSGEPLPDPIDLV